MTEKVFGAVRPELDFPSDESKVLAFWKANKIFEKTLAADTRATGPSKGTFVFYEGPPTANGMPHNGHVLTRAVKDVFPRYKTMQGYDVPRKGGWDTHGLPVEVEVEKDLKIHGKADIEKYGVKPFIARCIDSVFRYTEAWEKLTDKIAFWVDQKNAYVTFHKTYVESVWWALAELHKKGLLYRGQRVCWWWPQGGTALSAAEVGWNYKTVDDPSCFVAFDLVDEPGIALVAWTTTPWTLPSNMYAAVNSSFDYVVVSGWDKKLILAKALVEPLAKKLKKELVIERELKGAELVGKRYVPPFDFFERDEARQVWTVIHGDFVALDAGTGIVHVAPAFGEDDYNAYRALWSKASTERLPPPFNLVKPDGTFNATLAPLELENVFVKEADKALLVDLDKRNKLVFKETYRHEYPFCWRADDDPLIQLARPAWYIRTQPNKDKAIANNRAVHWLPEHIKEGRFGDFLENNVDWALSRERFWGTPLNVWLCDAGVDADSAHQHAPSSIAEIERLNPQAFAKFHEDKKKDPSLNEHLIVHKPWIDAVTFKCTHHGCSGTMRRVSEVIDAWFDSGSMPFAQWGYPHAPGSKEKFDNAFPANFISEAIDQTRGWFYSLLMISTLVFDEETQKRIGLSRVRAYPHPYETCVVLGHVSDREGKKESKSKGNYTPPEVILERVRMEFAVVLPFEKTKEVKPGVIAIAREDYEGLDLQGESAKVSVYREGHEAARVELELRPTKALPRRIVAVHPDDMEKLGVKPEPDAIDTKPNDVFRLPRDGKVYLEDRSTPAPGADAFRWFFYASSPPWTNTRHSLTNVRATQKEFAIKLRNVFSFFTIYANIDGFTPSDARGKRPAKERTLLDRWILSELALATRDVTKALDGYLLYDAATRLVDLVDALSNWYVRRGRSRYWAPLSNPSALLGENAAKGDAAAQDKVDAYFTLHEVLVAIGKLAAPFIPFFAEEMYQNLVRGPFPDAPGSVHLTRYPEVDEAAIDEALARDMRLVRELVSLGLQVRTANKLKVRQPLSRADIVVGSKAESDALKFHVELVKEELNVEEVKFLEPGQEGGAVRYVLKPNFRALGPKLGKKVQLAKQVLAKADAAAIRTELAAHGKVTVELDGEKVELTTEEIEVAVEATEGFAAAGGRAGVVVLHTTLDDRLRDRGLVREVISRVQALRKDIGLGFTDRIRLAVNGSERMRRVVAEPDFKAEIAGETLATEIVIGDGQADAEKRELNVDGEELVLVMQKDG